ncbi:MAG TPA: glutathionylspermidine synthase family protein [Candidatus Solibacter sp.]|nr:glutathionylspermidine synthase family protein [Candidatus Solibacter sp.]
MTAPCIAGAALEPERWLPLRMRAMFDFCKWDVQCDDLSVLSPFPLFLEQSTATLLNKMAEALTWEALAAEEEILENPTLIGRLGLTHKLEAALRARSRADSGVHELRVMRFDFHPTAEGWRISEVNADVPGGFIEASGWNSLLAGSLAGATAPPCTSELYAQRVLEAVGENALVALVHATAYSDDRQVMQHLARCFSARGLRTCFLSPSHLRWIDGRAEIRASFASGWPDAIVRFFPAEWLPNLARKDLWKDYFQKTHVSISNPGAAILLQSKRFPLIWDELRADLSIWRRLLPQTLELRDIKFPLDDEWVLKPALGRVGEGIGIRGITPEPEFQKISRHARENPGKWLAQKRFEILPVTTDEGEKYPCIGVFTIGGKAAGFYGRIADKPIINGAAQDAAVLIISMAEERSE